VERGIFAAPSYLARRGTPRMPDDLAGHDCIVLSFASAVNRWPFHDGHAVRIVEIASRIIIHEAEAALRLAIGGAGIVRLGDLIAGAAVRAGQLVPLLTAHHVVEPVPLSAVYPQGRHRMPKVRAFVDFLVERFGHAPWRQGA
jgi:DNA-binding transcriptional LysR family regulator